MSKLLLKTFIKEILKEEADRWSMIPGKKLRVFDLDDTLVKTNSLIRLTKASGENVSMTPGEYAVYEKEPGDEFDYSDFRRLVDPKVIPWTLKILKRVVAKHGNDSAVILTARGAKEPAEEFLKMNDIPNVPVVALNDSHPDSKAQWILMVIKRFGYTEVEFFDDSPKNIKAVSSLKSKVPPGVKVIARLIKP